ncbi:hypothetical protein LOD99_13981 [Oopsacas minuta]|uniref:Ciliary microtubule inner protein 2C n=1 Tax=Oopsacas minuta TaxID=111878 RepID=A0AAV7KHM8_9METZ|nr:hypothetical protein LOD99_13981 [Oopsacas minuta]
MTTFVNSTYSADFQIPGEVSGKIPGYGGYCPRIKYEFGRTFGESTRRTLEELRQRATSSSSNRSTHFSLRINPSQAPRWKSNQTYRLLNTAEERDKYITLHQRVQMQRHQYKDKSGRVYPLPDFEMPGSRQSKTSDGGKELLVSRGLIPRTAPARRPQSSTRDRAIRDVFFQKR